MTLFWRHVRHTAGLVSLLVIAFSSLAPVRADWNTGKTIEDFAARLAVNVIESGVQVKLTLKPEFLQHFDGGIEPISAGIIRFRTDRELSQAPAMASRVMADQSQVIELMFPFGKERPEKLWIAPDFSKLHAPGLPFLITIAHEGLPVIDHSVLTDEELLVLDWSDPWKTQFENPELKRVHNDPVMGFLYIESGKIRSELVIRVEELSNWVELGLGDERLIAVDQFAAIKQKAGQFLLRHNPLRADGKLLEPSLDSIDFIRMGATDIQAYEPEQPQLRTTTMIGVSVTYPLEVIPQQVQWTWELFSDAIDRIVIRAYDAAGLYDSYVTSNHPIFEWDNMLADIELSDLDDRAKPAPVPVASQPSLPMQTIVGIAAIPLVFITLATIIGLRFAKPRLAWAVILLGGIVCAYLWRQQSLTNLLAPDRLAPASVKNIIEPLLWNVYLAFESAQESETYDRLAYSLSADLIEEFYLQKRQAFVVDGGAWSKVDRIELIESAKTSKPSEFDCQWLVSGQVVHWGHQHRRENRYRARLRLMPIDHVWKIVELQPLDQQRVPTANGS